MQAPEQFAAWMASYEFQDKNGRLPAGLKLQYHSRSSEPSRKLAEFIVDDLVASSAVLREHAAAGDVAYAIDREYVWPNGKRKKLDLAIGIPPDSGGLVEGRAMRRLVSGSLKRLLIGIEEKAVMTEHGKSQPRVYSELNDSHVIIHQGDRRAIAGGITSVNIAATFVSPLRQAPTSPVVVTQHSQPTVTTNMVGHLRGLPVRHDDNGVGFDAYCTFVVDVDNQGHVALHGATPAPQPGDLDHYQTFVSRIVTAYEQRFSNLNVLAEPTGLSIEEALLRIAQTYPGLLTKIGAWAVSQQESGAAEVNAILLAIEGGPAKAQGED